MSKCPYCDFNSHKAGDAPPRQRYVEALKADLAGEAGTVAGRKVETIFLGGGTPSLFSAAEIKQILDAAHALFDVAGDAEITLEANPGTVECGALASYRSAGVNRLSLGAQSFDTESLQRLGRIHGSADIYAAFEEARAAAFGSINIDLMFGLPGQTLAMAQSDIRNAIDLKPQHISYYQLTLEANTVFHRHPPENMPSDDTAFVMQEASHACLKRAGFARYEVSAFARPGFECRHNLNYWLFGDYIAVGAGAHGKLTDGRGRIYRYQKPAHPIEYIKTAADRSVCPSRRQIGREDVLFEYMLNVLRLPQGFTNSGFEARTGLDYETIRPRLEDCGDEGLLRQTDTGIWQPTRLGLSFLNDLQAKFLPPKKAI